MEMVLLNAEQVRQLFRDELEAYHNGNAALTQSNDTSKKILNLIEFCEYTGLSKQTAYKLTSAQKVPHSKRGKRLYFDREKVDAWLLENQVATRTEIQKKANDYISKSHNRRRM